MAQNRIDLWHTVHPNGGTTTEPHDGQKQVLASSSRFRVVVCGRRWGKSMMAVIMLLLEALKTPDGLYWYVAPTYKQAKNIAWRFLMSRIRLFPKHWQDQCKIDKQNLTIELPNHAIIELKGAQEPDTLVGSGLNGVVLDEYAMDAYGVAPVWKQAIRPALSDKMGWAVFISTPRGYNHFFELFDYAQSSGDSEWEAWRMPTATNPYITKKELEAARREVGEDMFSQEYMAEFKKRSGLVYKEFDRSVHVIKPLQPHEIGSEWRLEVGIDFGTAHPTAAIFVLFDHVHDRAYVVDEHYEAEMHSETHVKKILEKEAKWLKYLRNKKVKRIGDSQAKQLIMDYARYGYYMAPTLKGDGSVDRGIGDIQKRLAVSPVTGMPQLVVTSECPNTIREFENYQFQRRSEAIETDEMMMLATKGKDAPRKIFDDAMDALRYVIQYHTPPGVQMVQRGHRVARNPITGI
jgi:hypothetical protein